MTVLRDRSNDRLGLGGGVGIGGGGVGSLERVGERSRTEVRED